MKLKRDWIKTGRVLVYEKAPIKGKKYGKTSKAFSSLRGKAGVYRIFENRRLVYVGSSTHDIYKIILRKFQVWNDGRERLYYDASKNDYKIEAILIPKTKGYIDAVLDLENYLILKYKPRDNKPENYSFYNRRDIYEPVEIQEKVNEAPKLSAKELEEMDIPF